MSDDNQNQKVRLLEVSQDRDGQRLDNFLLVQLKGVPKSRIYRIVRKGEVRVNGKRSKPMAKLRAGDTVRIPPIRTTERKTPSVPPAVLEQLQACTLYEDADLLVLDKPAGMAVHAGSQLSWGIIEALRQLRSDEQLELVHRLDRETSGCLLLARNRAALRHYTQAFREGTVQKIYLALMNGKLPEDVVEVDEPLLKGQAGGQGRVFVDERGKSARTRFTQLESWKEATYVRAEIFTGRTHQIRAHAEYLGLPLAGDAVYSNRETVKRWKNRGLNRLFLHANFLKLQTPAGDSIEFSSPLSEELKDVLDRLA